ncbi:hypothetical protein GCM10025864_34750 [Luteimicrobium album]|uniref:Uncharacterized protein n=1 Tax=Luteimicrobium album TaxID=1054550 RepID=A0ABQ6I4X6_9MICO|nr:hypothetical protein [Luteimicrobium album]GMA25716.1 hypothetical protein GCM10025864_34750 [Luteimicrobium album]
MRAGRFGLTPATRTLGLLDGAGTALRADGLSQSPVAYLDFTLDGERVHDVVTRCVGHEPDDVSALQDAWPIGAVEAIERLLGLADPDLPDGRASIYVCPECQDLGCRAVTALVRFTDNTVEWSDLGFQNENFPDVDLVDDDGAALSFEFGRARYEEVLRGELVRFRELSVGWVHPRTAERRRRRQRWLARLRMPFRGPSGRA